MTFSEEEDEDTLVEEGAQIECGLVSPRDTRHCEILQRSIRDKRNPREAFFDLGDVKVENVIVALMKRRMKTFSWRKDLKLNATLCFTRDTRDREIHPRNSRDKRFPREACFDLGDVEVEKDIVTFIEEEGEGILVEGRPQIERATVSLRDTCHREIHPRNSRDKRFPREACFNLGDVKVEKDIVTTQ